MTAEPEKAKLPAEIIDEFERRVIAHYVVTSPSTLEAKEAAKAAIAQALSAPPAEIEYVKRMPNGERVKVPEEALEGYALPVYLSPPAASVGEVEKAILLEMSDRRLLDDVDDDLHAEIGRALATAAIRASLGKATL